MVDHCTQGNISVFAARFGYSRAQISQYLSETYNEGRSIGERAARTLEKKVGVHTGWLDGLPDPIESTEQPPRVRAHDVLPNAAQDAGKKRLKVLFMVTTVKDMKGFVDLTHVPDDDEHSEIEFYTASKSAYALAVSGSGLRPRVKSGEFLVVEPAIAPSPGDDVFVKLTPKVSAYAPQLVMQFLYKRSSEITFGHLNEDGPTLTVQESEILSMFPITAVLGSLYWASKIS